MSQSTFQQQLRKYALLIVNLGVQIQPGDTLVLQIGTDQVPFAQYIVAQAYQAGAAEVFVDWQNPFVLQQQLLHTPTDLLVQTVQLKKNQIDTWIARNAKQISVLSKAPDAFADVPSATMQAYQTTLGQVQLELRQRIQNNQFSWTVVAAASPDWAQKVFPKETPAKALTLLWQAIFEVTKVDTADPFQAWQQQDYALHQKASWLNTMQFDALHYEAPGTDLYVGLPKNHLWSAASSQNAKGQRFFPNLPTEEVFTAPDRHRIRGTVAATKPVSYRGQILSGLNFTFEEGQIIQATAKTGQVLLDQLLSTDDGAKSLGEVALVPENARTAQINRLFYNTLLDENTANHFALGAAYPFSIQNGSKLNVLEQQIAGLNHSLIHMDFMVGSTQMKITGRTMDGTWQPIFIHGLWANEK